MCIGIMSFIIYTLSNLRISNLSNFSLNNLGLIFI